MLNGKTCQPAKILLYLCTFSCLILLIACNTDIDLGNLENEIPVKKIGRLVEDVEEKTGPPVDLQMNGLFVCKNCKHHLFDNHSSMPMSDVDYLKCFKEVLCDLDYKQLDNTIAEKSIDEVKIESNATSSDEVQIREFADEGRIGH